MSPYRERNKAGWFLIGRVFRSRAKVVSTTGGGVLLNVGDGAQVLKVWGDTLKVRRPIGGPPFNVHVSDLGIDIGIERQRALNERRKARRAAVRAKDSGERRNAAAAAAQDPIPPPKGMKRARAGNPAAQRMGRSPRPT